MISEFGFSGLFIRVAEPLTRWSEPGEQTAAVDETDIHVAEAHNMVAGLDCGDAKQSSTRASPMKMNSPFHLISPLPRTRRTW